MAKLNAQPHDATVIRRFKKNQCLFGFSSLEKIVVESEWVERRVYFLFILQGGRCCNTMTMHRCHRVCVRYLKVMKRNKNLICYEC